MMTLEDRINRVINTESFANRLAAFDISMIEFQLNWRKAKTFEELPSSYQSAIEVGEEELENMSERETHPDVCKRCGGVSVDGKVFGSSLTFFRIEKNSPVRYHICLNCWDITETRCDEFKIPDQVLTPQKIQESVNKNLNRLVPVVITDLGPREVEPSKPAVAKCCTTDGATPPPFGPETRWTISGITKDDLIDPLMERIGWTKVEGLDCDDGYSTNDEKLAHDTAKLLGITYGVDGFAEIKQSSDGSKHLL